VSSDMVLRTTIVARLLAALGPVIGRVRVTVFNGVAMLSGDVDTADERDVVERTARSVPSVRGVVDGLHIIDRRVAPALS
jgi:osmotically-inducible protein OsmY